MAAGEQAVELAVTVRRVQQFMNPSPAARSVEGSATLGNRVEEVAEEPLRVGLADRAMGPERELPGGPDQGPVVGEAIITPAHLAGEGMRVGVVRLPADRLVADVRQEDPAP